MCKTLIVISLLILFLILINHYIDKFNYTDFNDYKIVEDAFGFHIEYAQWIYGTKHYVNDIDSNGNIFYLADEVSCFNYWQDFLIEE
jgi:hypothetical protein